MKVSREVLVSIYEELGSKSASSWSPEKLLEKVEDIPDHVQQDTQVTEQAVLEQLLSAIAEGEEIELINDPKPAKGKGKSKNKTAAAEEEDSEEDHVPLKKSKAKAAKGKPAAKGKDKAAKSSKKPAVERVGVVAVIKETLSAASAEKPVSKEKMLQILVKKFPERNEDSMKTTVGCQFGYHLKAKGISVQKNEKGYWIGDAPKAAKKKANNGKGKAAAEE